MALNNHQNSVEGLHVDRRQFLQGLAGSTLTALSPVGLATSQGTSGATPPSREVFATRSYYILLMRMPYFGLEDWKAIFRCMHEDRCNMVILWMAGGFRSKKFPITWQYNQDHKNVQADFTRELIDFGHSLGMKIVLGVTPFSYDGVNRYTLEHPELKAYQKNGNLNKLDGMHSWGYALNPSRSAAQKFMLEYASEMYFDFYPNADGLRTESSDYEICHCPDCAGHYYEREFEFVKAISDRVWQRYPSASMIVDPFYFSPAGVPLFGVQGAQEQYDPRWTLFYTPGIAPVDKDLVKKASHNIYWSEMTLSTPQQVKKTWQTVRDLGIDGHVTSLEPYSYVVRYPDDSYWQMIGRRIKSFGYEWLDDDTHPYEYLLTKVLRIAFREFSRDPDLSFDTYSSILHKELFTESTPLSAVDDLLELQKIYVTDRGWYLPGPTMSPEIMGWHLDLGRVSPAKLADYRSMLESLKRLHRKYQGQIHDPSLKEIARVTDWAVQKWAGKERILLDPSTGLAPEAGASSSRNPT